MKMHVMGCKRIAGVAKATGNEFDMHALIVRVPLESGSFGKVRIDGAGFETAEVELDPSGLAAFKALQGQYPLDLELVTEQKFHRGEFKTFVTGHTHKGGVAAPVAKIG